MRYGSFLKLMSHLAFPETEPELARAHPQKGTLEMGLPFHSLPRFFPLVKQCEVSFLQNDSNI